MRRFLGIAVFVVIFGGCGHWPWSDENVVKNPGFDGTPWDAHWAIDTATSTEKPQHGNATAIVEAK